MTRRAGFVPVVLSPNEAEKIAAWVLTIAFPEPTILGSAGLSPADLKANDRAVRNQLRELCACLLPRRTGRPRLKRSTYQLPASSLKLIDKRSVAYQAPDDIRGAVASMIAAGKRKRGVRLSLADRKRNVAITGPNSYQEETRRNYRWRISRLEEASIKHRADSAKLSARVATDARFRKLLFGVFLGVLPFE